MSAGTEQNVRVLDQFGKQAASYAALIGKSQDTSLPALLNAVRPMPSHRMLDVGCGTGRFALSLAPLLGHVVGVDLTPAMLEQARQQQADAQITNVEWQQADVMKLPFNAEEFDLVTCKAMLHHVIDPAAVIAEMHRVCRDGGYVVATDVTPRPEKSAAANAIEILRDPSHAQFLTREELRGIGAALGLTEVVVHDYVAGFPLEPVLRSSFPAEGMVDRVRKLYHIDAQVGADALGLGAAFAGDEVCLAYPMTMIVWRRTAC